MIEPFMANVGTGGIVASKTEGNVPAGNAKTMEPCETNFQTILENVCSDAVEKPVAAEVESWESPSVKPIMTGERQNVAGLNRLGKPALPVEAATEEPLSIESEMIETDNNARQTSVNHEIIPVIQLEMLNVTRINTLLPEAEGNITSGENVNPQPVMKANDIRRPDANGNPKPVVPFESTDIVDTVNSQNTEAEALPELLGQTQKATGQPVLEQAEVVRDDSWVISKAPEQNRTLSASRKQMNRVEAEVRDTVGRENHIQSAARQEKTLADTGQSLPTTLNTVEDFQRTKPRLEAISEVEQLRPVEPTVTPTVTLKTTVKSGSPVLEKAAAVPVTPQLPESTLTVSSTEAVVNNLQPVRDLQRQTTVAMAVATGAESKAAGALTRSEGICQVLSETVSPETEGIIPWQSVESSVALVPSEMPVIVTDLSSGMDSNLNLAIAQLSLQKKPINLNHGGKPPVIWNTTAIIRGMRPQIVESNTSLIPNINPSTQGETLGLGLNQTPGSGSNLVAIAAGQGQSNPGSSTDAEHFGSNPAPLPQPATGDPVITTVPSGYSWKEVLQTLTAPPIAKYSVAEVSTGQKPEALRGAEENQPLDVPTVITVAVPENPLQGIREVNFPTEPAVNKQEVFDQLVEKAKIMVNQGQSEMELSLKPEHLGKLKLKIAVDQQVVTAQFTVESEQIKQIIETNLVQLRKLLQDTGAQVENLTITVGQQDAGTNFSQQSNSDSHRSRPHQAATVVAKKGLDFAPEITQSTQSKALIDLIA